MALVYILRITCYNGTVTMFNHTYCFKTRELAEKTIEKLKDINTKYDEKNTSFYNFSVHYDIEEYQLFENESEIAIFNQS